jgi:hypothetical protein
MERTVVPLQRMEICLTLFSVEELADMGEHRHG